MRGQYSNDDKIDQITATYQMSDQHSHLYLRSNRFSPHPL